MYDKIPKDELRQNGEAFSYYAVAYTGARARLNFFAHAHVPVHQPSTVA
jgi:hypothetical protein